VLGADTIQETSRALYDRYPAPVTIVFIIVAAAAAFWLFQFLFLMPRKTQLSAPTAVNFQGQNIQPIQVNVFGGQVTVAPPPAPNAPLPSSGLALVENGSFELGSDGWGTGFFESLFASPGGAALAFNGALAHWFVDDQRAHSGRKALRVEHSSTYAPHVFSAFSQRIKVKPHQRYEVTFWAYLEATDRSAFSLRVLPSRRIEPHEWDRFKSKLDPHLLGRWQEVRREFESGSDTFFDLRFAAEAALKVWVDDVVVTPLDGN